MSSPKKRKTNAYSRLAPVGYSPQYQRWHEAAKKGDQDAIAEAHLAHARFLQTRPWAVKLAPRAGDAPILEFAA
jgi:hypothetical protein